MLGGSVIEQEEIYRIVESFTALDNFIDFVFERFNEILGRAIRRQVVRCYEAVFNIVVPTS